MVQILAISLTVFCFAIIQKLYDTLGIHLHHRQAAVVHSEDLPALAPQSRLRGHSVPVSFLSTVFCEVPFVKYSHILFFWLLMYDI